MGNRLESCLAMDQCGLFTPVYIDEKQELGTGFPNGAPLYSDQLVGTRCILGTYANGLGARLSREIGAKFLAVSAHRILA